MKPTSAVEIKFFNHENGMVEYVVYVDQKQEFSIKTTPKKWCNSNHPLRVFEEWLLDKNTKEKITKVGAEKIIECLQRYHEVEEKLITTIPMLHEEDKENYSDSYKWLRLPMLGESPETIGNMILLDVELLPNDCLAGILLTILKNQVPIGVQMKGLGIYRDGNSFRFCISGSTSKEDLQTLYEQYKQNHCFLNKT